jgi:hypothetical protein
MNPRYWLNDPDGNPVITELKLNNPNATRGNQIFFGSELQLIARADEDDPDLDEPIVVTCESDLVLVRAMISSMFAVKH